jgi:F-type H+-transporting ATPase subunit delta
MKSTDYKSEILALALSKEELDQIIYDISSFASVIGYKSVVANGTNDKQKRKILIASELSGITSKSLKHYFESLLKKDDLTLFEPGVFKNCVEDLKEQGQKTVHIELTTAIEIKEKDLKKITDDLSKKLGRKVVIDNEVDKSIMGGALIKKDNYIVDFSLKTKLANLNIEWKKSIHKSRA